MKRISLSIQLRKLKIKYNSQNVKEQNYKPKSIPTQNYYKNHKQNQNILTEKMIKTHNQQSMHRNSNLIISFNSFVKRFIALYIFCICINCHIQFKFAMIRLIQRKALVNGKIYASLFYQMFSNSQQERKNEILYFFIFILIFVFHFLQLFGLFSDTILQIQRGLKFMKKRLNVVLTGGNIGIGFETVKGLATDGHYVIFGSRNVQRNQQALQKLRNIPNARVDSFYLDLSNKKSVQQFSQNVKKALDNGPIDMLINNSGLLIDNKRMSEMGIQMTMQINHFGHFYLTYLLFDNLKKSKQARIINVASYAHTFVKGPNTLENIRQDEGDYDMMTQYSKSKLANIQFTAGLAQRLEAHKISNIKTVSLHPGVVDSGFYQNTTKWYLRCFTCCCCCFLISSQTGARTSLYLARCPFQQLRNGQYCNDKQAYEPLRDNAKNEKFIQQLWSFSEKLYEIQFSVK